MDIIKVFAVILVFIWIIYLWRRGLQRQQQGLPDKDYDPHFHKLSKRAAYVAGKELSRTFRVGTLKKSLRHKKPLRRHK
jgi:hypothetical protein